MRSKQTNSCSLRRLLSIYILTADLAGNIMQTGHVSLSGSLTTIFFLKTSSPTSVVRKKKNT